MTAYPYVLLCACAVALPGVATGQSPVILNEYNAVSSSNFLKENNVDTFFGAVQGNGGDWFAAAGLGIDDRNTQFRILDAQGHVAFGPAGEGAAPRSGVNAEGIFELETQLGSPSFDSFRSSQDPTVGGGPGYAEGYDDGGGASGSTFGMPNSWLDDTLSQRFDGVPPTGPGGQAIYPIDGITAVIPDWRFENAAPAFNSDPATQAEAGSLYAYTVTASDDSLEPASLLFSVTDLPQWLELVLNGDGTALLTGTPASNDVDPSITLQVTDGDGATNEQTFFIAIAGSTGGVSYEAWLTENAGLQGDDAFPQADPEGDLVPNVVEFALGGDPLATDTAGLYSVFREGEELYLRHTIRSAAAGVTRTLEASSSFEPEAWENAADRLELVDRSPSGMPGVETLTYRILEVISQPLSGFRVRINSF